MDIALCGINQMKNLEKFLLIFQRKSEVLLLEEGKDAYSKVVYKSEGNRAQRGGHIVNLKVLFLEPFWVLILMLVHFTL